MKDKIFILKTKRSKDYSDTTYCIAIFKLGTDFAEFIIGKNDNDRKYKIGDEISYVYDADYTSDLEYALILLNQKK